MQTIVINVPVAWASLSLSVMRMHYAKTAELCEIQFCVKTSGPTDPAKAHWETSSFVKTKVSEFESYRKVLTELENLLLCSPV